VSFYLTVKYPYFSTPDWWICW